ncbi:MAG: hypothetical protein AB7K71_09235 [Polyangiaceae bacterium]
MSGSGNAAVEYVVVQLEHGTPQEEIVESLINQGVDEGEAEDFVEGVAAARINAIREAGKSNMTKGALWCIGGLIVTAITYSAAAGGGTYVVTWGAIIFGAIQFFKGVGQSNQQ